MPREKAVKNIKGLPYYINVNFNELMTRTFALSGKGFFFGLNCRWARLIPAAIFCQGSPNFSFIRKYTP
jgi:hypothetical protein